MNTPDTEVDELVKLNRTCGCAIGWCKECLKLKGVIELALISRDTYWKEKVRKGVEKTRAWAEVSYKRGYEDGKNSQPQELSTRDATKTVS